MGEMIKFGIKLAMTIACAIALVAAIAMLYSTVSSALSDIPSVSAAGSVLDVFRIVQVYLPFNVWFVFTSLTTLGAFKIAYWAADKMIQFISASS